MKRVIKNIFPMFLYLYIRVLARYIRLARSYLYDLNHYFQYSMSMDNNTKNKLVSKIILDTHVIEKGLTMPEFRLGFGQIRLAVLLTNVEYYISEYEGENPQVLHALSVINEYFKVHDKSNYSVSAELLKAKNIFFGKNEINVVDFKERHQINVTKSEYFDAIDKPFFQFSESRSSIRNFSQEPVELAEIKLALDLCRNTPSACNRQSVRVHLFKDKNTIEEILNVQGGNRGFGHLANFLIVVTYEPSMYFEESERNSGIVDGGMYCMNILYALHAKKMTACILNAAHSGEKDLAMRKVARIPASEVFVAMIAGGKAADKFKVATSYRYPLEKILEVH